MLVYNRYPYLSGSTHIYSIQDSSVIRIQCAQNGGSLYARQICNPGALAHASQDGGERERVRAALLRNSAVLSEPSVLGVRAPSPVG